MNTESLSQRLKKVEVVLSELSIAIKDVTAEVRKEELVGSDSILEYSVDILELAPRIERAFDYHKIKTIGDLVNISKRRLVLMRGIGNKAVKSLESGLATYGLKLKE